MLKIYYADALTDREKYIFENIDPERKTILIVPDQMSLSAERDALRLLGKKSLMEFMVTDFSALGHKVVRETCGREPAVIDKYGRHMLLSVLIGRLENELTLYRSYAGRTAFTEQMNTLISEMKRYELAPDDLGDALDRLKGRKDEERPAASWLSLKLADTLLIYRAYEEAIAGIYQDAEDYITFYADRIPESELIRGAEIWISGFDSFTPKNIMVIGKLLASAENVHVVLTKADGSKPASPLLTLTRCDGEGLFGLTDVITRKLTELADGMGIPAEIGRIEGNRRQTVWEGGEEEIAGRITLARTSGIYEEAERAAAFIMGLVRDEGYRYGDIAVICNDIDGRGGILRRTLQRWGIPVFADRKRHVLHQPVISFLLSFLDCLTKGLDGDSLMEMVKTGLPGFTDEDADLLENYTTEFRIRGKRWQEEFVWDGGSYTEEELKRLNEMREFLVSASMRAKDSIGRRNTAGEKIQGLYAFLTEDFRLPERIAAMVERQQGSGLSEGAAETAQIWNAVCGLFEQIERVIGEEKVSNTLLRDMIASGLESMEIGLVPSSEDCVVMGTLQRTRPGRVRALAAVGVCEGVLPMEAEEEGLLSRREKEILSEMDLEVAGKDAVTLEEEQLAVYRIFSAPSEKLFVSCSQYDSEGKKVRPSLIFEALRRIKGEVLGDLGQDSIEELLISEKGTVSFLAEALRRQAAGEKTDPVWGEVRAWYEENAPSDLQKILEGSRFTNRKEALGAEMADALYRGDAEYLEASASRLELFSGCPFAHFISYGLKGREQRLFEVGGREIGDIYHQCMMEYSRRMSGRPEDGPTWDTVTEGECRDIIGRILEGTSGQYREGVFKADGSSEFRMERIREICGDIAWVLTGQIRSGSIRQMRFEEAFGRGGTLPAKIIEAGGRKVRVSGVIDRLDILNTGEGMPDSFRIVDYKTGNNKIDTDEFEKGYQLQLMIYLDAVSNMKEQPEPAGVFYFKIREFTESGEGKKLPEDRESLQKALEKAYRMEGVVINDSRLIGAQDALLSEKQVNESMVIPVKYDEKNGCYKPASGGTLLETETFRELQEETNRQVERICREMYEGVISALPTRKKDKDKEGNRITACRFCNYRSICGFDPAIRGCRYRDD